ncbi:helicase-exonuclease AddAB subunit AddA [Clostridium sp. Marseille-Q2269]|uniref:helicase-exonuclease AddAB subunit AddA n=1 Tax=Clostridium sp. Marseille-Q2269 TaxID=2942205 RepID=UPI0020747DE7|nr:helicase-exonuclease AddAB subunit AddA [Clostridium sp. Marseille-Q2269]
MGNTRWTEEQRQAISTKDCNLLVAAGAGAGKTAVLVQRIIEKILDKEEPIDIDKLLVVTFTNAAAAEMRERIGDAISEGLDENPESKVLRKQLTLLNKSNIMTIHSFCLQVIKNNFHTIDIDPNFRICDETEGVLMRQEAMDELFEELYEEDNEQFINLVESYASRKDIRLQEMVFELHRFAKSAPLPYKWLLNMAEEFNVGKEFDFEHTSWANMIMEDMKVLLYGFKNILEQSIDLILNSIGIDYYYEPFKNDLYFINDLIKASKFKDFREKVIGYDFDKLPAKRNKDADKEAKEKVKKLRDKVKKKILELKHILHSYENEFIKNEFIFLYPYMKALSDLTILFDKKYEAKKRERDLIDFNDIEHLCLAILTDKDENGDIIPSDIALDYRKRFKEVLIDEYQDSNLVQEVIMSMVSRVKGHWSFFDGQLVFNEEEINFHEPQTQENIPNRFMVGDVKQSIYRFRQAKPEIFLEKYNKYNEEEVSKYRKIKLFKNFRSREEVINGVNYVFKQIMSKTIGELDYTEEEALSVGASYGEEVKGEPIELCLMDKKYEISEEVLKEYNMGEEEALDNIQLEGRLVAKKIQEVVGNNLEGGLKVFDKKLGGYRGVQYRDIVILMRATSNWAPVFVEELAKEGIPVFADTNSGYFDTTEIKTIISLLQIIDNPLQDIPLLSVLRSPIASFTDDELIDIRMINKNIAFYECMEIIYRLDKNLDDSYYNLYVENEEKTNRVLKDMNDELKNKICSFIEKLNSWRKKSIHMDIDEFIWFLYVETGYYGYVGALPGGEQRQANLRILFQRARQYEKSSYKGLFNFINFINKLKFSSGDMGSAKILGENENVVRIMSIHKSKGLEFPVVILSGTGKNFNMTDLNKSILFHRDLGYGPDYVNTERRIAYPSLVKNIIKNKIKLETLSEEMRILYVALTRAREKLIITGLINNIDKTVDNWLSLSEDKNSVPEYAVISGKTYLDWIGPVIIKHKDAISFREELDIVSELSNIVDDKSKWKIQLWNKKELLKEKIEDNEEGISEKIKKTLLELEESNYKEEIYRRLSFNYKYDSASNIPTKLSVSDVKKQFIVDEEDNTEELFKKVELRTPMFMEGKKKISASERGTIIHLFMQHLDLKQVENQQEIKAQIDRLIKREFITYEQSKVIKPYKILKFCKSELGKRMIKSNSINREMAFSIEAPPGEIYKELDKEKYKEEKVIIQGIIDCYFEEEDGLVLIDYKTDYVENIEEIRNRYKIQIKYYEEALNKITGKSVKDKYLYLFSIDDYIKIH